MRKIITPMAAFDYVAPEHEFDETVMTVPDQARTPRELLEAVDRGTLDLQLLERQLTNDDESNEFDVEPGEIDLAHAGKVINQGSDYLQERQKQVEQQQEEFEKSQQATDVDAKPTDETVDVKV